MTNSAHAADRNTPLIVGVTGHRDLNPSDAARVRAAVGAFAEELRGQLPHTEIRFMVGMADGADLLVAQTVLDLGLYVDAVLPMPLSHYGADFSAEALRRLQLLLQHPHVRAVELPLRPDGTHDVLVETAADRDAAYARLTRALIRSCGLLLALWDGRPSVLPGGTADTVLRFLGVRGENGEYAEELAFEDSAADVDPVAPMVYWIPVERGDGAGDAELRAPCYLSGTGDNLLQRHRGMPPTLRRQLTGLDHYNLEFQKMTAAGRITAVDSLMATLPAGAAPQERAELECVDAQYGKADALAVYYQRRSDRLFGFYSVMTFAMGIAYLAYERISEARVLLYAYLSILLVGLGLHYLLRGRHWFTKHLLFRSLAETLRARFYLLLGGAADQVRAAEVITLSGIDQFDGFAWIVHALKCTELPGADAAHAAGAARTAAHGSYAVDDAWIEPQRNYFTAKVAKLERSSRRIARLRRALLFVVLVVIVVLIVFEESLRHRTPGLGDLRLKNLLQFFMGGVAVLFGVWELHQHKMATQELLWQYRNQLGHFSRATAELARTTARDRRREIIAALGRNSLMESYLWTIHRYHREHEPPATS